jgi:uncharacterized protein YdaU (DUF1376 family)
MSSRSDIWMPIYIGDLLGDTQHLTNEQFGIYHRVFYHQWRHGHFSEDDLFVIARVSSPSFESASSTFQAEFKQALSKVLAPIKKLLSEDGAGLLFSARCDREKEKWTHKKRVFIERARKGGLEKARRIRDAKAASSSSSSVLETVLESCTSPSPIEEQKTSLTPTPSRDGMGRNAPSTPTRQKGTRKKPRKLGTSPRQLGISPKQLGTSPRQRGTNPRELGASPRQQGTSPRQVGSADKAKPTILPITDARKGTNGAHSHLTAKNGVAPGASAGNGHTKSSLHPVNGDLRLDEFEREILSFWKHQNPEHPDYAFSAPDRRALEDLLAREPGLVLPELRRRLRNRAHSEINPAAHPAKWLRNIIEYSAGPLGKYGKPRHTARAL